MSEADKEERILRLLLLATKAYQDNFESLRKKLFEEKNRDYLNLVTVQGTNTRNEVKLLSQIDLYEIHTVDDLISKAKELGI